MREASETSVIKTVLTALAIAAALAQGQAQTNRYVAGDFHQHTTYTDGTYSFGFQMSKNNQFGLDWWANSEAGGSFNRFGRISGTGSDPLGTNVTWAEAGITPGAYLKRYRIVQAMDHLIGSRRKIREIGQMVGYRDPAAFSRAFAQIAGTQPYLYRVTRRLKVAEEQTPYG